ncbi:MAG: terpene cyclase/mutase family protein [Planctomycetes bacterium]|nr:terpene cyclase/mutase family protein [Planctomycetota bacterium]
MLARFFICVGLCGLLGFTAEWGSAVARAQDTEPITAARNRAIAYLKEQQNSDGSWSFKDHDIGITALCTIALIENGVPLSDPTLLKGYEYVRKNANKQKNTYDLSLVVVLLSRFGDRRDKPDIKKYAARLMAGQMDSGGWHYTCPGAELDHEKVLKDVSLGPKPKEGYGDNSCTQFAVLGLWVASRAGVNIDKTLQRVAQRFGKSQTADGGWAYVAKTGDQVNGASESMTGAGLFCLAVAQANQIRDALKSGKKPEGELATGKTLLESPVFSKGFQRTGEFVKAVGPGSSRYFLWSVERVGVLLGLEQIGDVDWFQRGADGLLKTQREEGGWPTSWPETDKAGLSDTCFALLFLRRANLGSDISRLLEGEHEQKFQILGRRPAARFDTLEDAVAASASGDTIRIEGNGPPTGGPWKLGSLELKHDLTIQAGFGYAPVFRFEITKNRLGIKLRPETDPNGRHMIGVTGGQVTLEGLRLQMDPPKDLKKSIPWRAITVKGGSLRLLNCSISEVNKQGTVAIVNEGDARLVVRNCILVGGKAGIELSGSGHRDLLLDNSVVFSNGGILLATEDQSKTPVDVSINIGNSVFQVKDVVVNPAKLSGTIHVTSRATVYQADWVGTNFLVSLANKTGRSWQGAVNLYDVKNWIGAGGKSVPEISSGKDWLKYWGNTETNSFKVPAPFVAGGLRQVGNFTHELTAQDWQLDFPPQTEPVFIRNRVGVNSYHSGPGQPYDQFRETISYSDWQRGVSELVANQE